MKEILHRLDACVYITDLETDDIIFINDKMAREFGGRQNFAGRKCWEVLQTGLSERCSFCPKSKLLENPEDAHVWEEHNTVTKKYYKNTDCIIDWTDGRKVHMQHSVDISDIKEANFVLQHQLAQQELMGEIAQSFTGVGEVEELALRAFEKIGNFIDAETIYIAQDNPEAQLISYIMCWNRGEVLIEPGMELSYAGQEDAYERIKTSELTVAQRLSEEGGGSFLGLQSLAHMGRITVPIIIKDTFWGFLGILSANCGTSFSGSDLKMAQFMGSILSKTFEHREAEIKLYRTEQQLRAVMDNISLAINWKDVDGKYVGFNQEFVKMIGARSKEVAGKTDTDFWGADFSLHSTAQDIRILDTGGAVNEELEVVFPGRGAGWLRIVKSLVRNKIGKPTGIVSIMEDITTQKQAELELLRMSAIVEYSSQFISYINKQGRFRYVNRAAVDITGYTSDELVAGGLELLFAPETMEQVRGTILPTIYQRGEFTCELPMVRKDGAVRILSFSSVIIGSGEYNCATIAADVTERRQLEDALLVEKEAAEKANTAKTEFLSRMSHEIRTPMNAIIGMTRIANKSDDVIKKQYCLDKIDVASRHLLGLINDILDMSRIEMQKFELESKEFELENMIMEAVNVITFLCDEKEQTLIAKIDDTLPPTVLSDEMRLKQVITNLLSNAIKFTDKRGTIHLNAKRVAHTDRTVTLRIEVQDNGIGIAPEQTERLFSAFEQGDGSITRKYGGSGLGLAICKNIVNLMGGEIWVESEVGVGSKFIFTVELDVGHASHESVALSQVKDGTRILVVDDAEEIRTYFKRIMDGFGVYCDTAADGYAALERVNLAREQGGYDIIFVDWKMPGMDGIELTRRLKSIMGENAVVIMISMSEWDKIEKQAKAVGIRKFLPKPLFPALLRDTIIEIVNTDSSGGTCLRGEEDYNFSGMRVLLAEDVEVNREIIFATLEPTNLSIDFAENGAIAVAMMEKNPDRYDLILMDIHMPQMDGYMATQRIRSLAYERAKTIPIIAMTADAFKEDIEKCKRAGMNSHIPKPVDRAELMETLKTYLQKSDVDSHKLKGDNQMNESFDMASVINVEEGLGRVLGSKKLYYKLLGDCKLNDHYMSLSGAISGGERSRALEIAHMVKGISANLSLTAVYQAIVDIETGLKMGSDANELLEKLRCAVEATSAAIDVLLSAG